MCVRIPYMYMYLCICVYTWILLWPWIHYVYTYYLHTYQHAYSWFVYIDAHINRLNRLFMYICVFVYMCICVHIYCISTYIWIRVLLNCVICVFLYILLHLECHLIVISNLNLGGLFSMERGKRDLENKIIDWDLRLKKWHSRCNRLYVHTRLRIWNWHILVHILNTLEVRIFIYV